MTIFRLYSLKDLQYKNPNVKKTCDRIIVDIIYRQKQNYMLYYINYIFTEDERENMKKEKRTNDKINNTKNTMIFIFIF